MINNYISNSGKRVIIKEMPNRYLLNSYSYYSARLKLIKSKVENKEQISGHLADLKEKIDSLWAEIQRRGILPMPS